MYSSLWRFLIVTGNGKLAKNPLGTHCNGPIIKMHLIDKRISLMKESPKGTFSLTTKTNDLYSVTIIIFYDNFLTVIVLHNNVTV